MKQMTMKQIREAIAFLSVVDMMHVECLAAGTINENAARIEYKAQGGRPVRYIHISSRARKANLDAIAAAVAEAIGAERWGEIVAVVTGEETDTDTEETEAVTLAPAEMACVWDENGDIITTDTTTEEEEEGETMTTANELQKYVDSIAADLRKLYEADLTDEEREAAEENGEAYDMYTYFADALDIEYTISSRGDFLGARIAVALGDPNVYVDTRECYVKGYWGTDRAEAWIPSEICEEIDGIMEEYYNMVRGA